MFKNTSFLKSLKHAFCGYVDCLKRERNLRFHTVVANLICFFAYHFGLSRAEWGILLLAIGFTISSELINSAIEKTVDIKTKEIRFDAKHAKDFGAAATLVSAIVSLGVGFALFGNLEKIILALSKIFTSVSSMAVGLVLLILDIYILLISKKFGGKYDNK